MFQRILVPLDGSPRAERALPVAAQIARATGGSLLLVQVIRLPLDYSGGLAPAPLLTDQFIESETSATRDYLTALAASPLLCGIVTRTHVSFGLPAQYLIAVAETQGIDLIVLCSHGRTGFTRWALGSVAHSLVHQSTIPLLVLRQPDDAALVKTRYPLRVLIPLDGSALSEAALIPAAHLVAALAASAQGTLHLTQVIKTTTQESVAREYDEALQHTRAYLKSVAERVQPTLNDLHLALTFSIESDADVASTLVNLAEQEGAVGCDLIAMSTHGRGGLKHWVMGSVTERILNTTRLPMLIVRPPKTAQ